MSNNLNLVNAQMKSHAMSKVSHLSHAETSTNMYPELLANWDKIEDKEDPILYHDERGGPEDDQEDKIDDEPGNYRSKQDIFSKVSEVKDQKDKYTDKKDKTEKSSDKPKSYNDSSTVESTEVDKNDPSNWTKEELMIKKLDMLRKLGELTKCGIKVSQNYSMDSDYETMKFEYDLHSGIRAKDNSINWMSNMMIGIVKGIELLNDNVNPFDIKFDNSWSNKVTHDIDSFHDVLGDIYEKYTTPGKPMAPELKLFLMLSGSAIYVQMYKGMQKTSNTAEKINSDPDRIRNLRKRANEDYDRISTMGDDDRNSVSEKSSGFKRKQQAINKQHDEAVRQALDLQKIKNDKREYENIKKMANSASINNLNSQLQFSESARSRGSQKSKNEQLDLDEYKKQIIKNQKLLDTKKLLQELDNEQESRGSSQNLQQIQKPLRQLKGSETKSKNQSSDYEIESTSAKSSSSKMSVHPELDTILGTVIKEQQMKKKVITSSSSSDDSSSSVSSSSSKSGIIVDCEEIRSSDRESRKKTQQVKKFDFDDEQITRETVSFGKKSNDSGSTSKRGRGRPRKEPIKFKLGQA